MAPPTSGTSAEALLSFEGGGQFTVGAEEELIITDGAGRYVSTEDAAILSALRDDPLVDCVVSPEMCRGQVELATPVCSNAHAVVEALARGRASITRHGRSAVAVGLHPTARFGDAETSVSPRIAAIAHELAGVIRTPTAAFQVHVGVPDEATMIRVYGLMRVHVPLFRALAAGSPYWHGRDSGLACARAVVVRSYPRTGVPPLLHDYEHYRSLMESLVAAAEVPDYTHFWWDVRPHPLLGTVEVRAMDAHWSLDRCAALVALVQGLARRAAAEPRPLDRPTALPTELVAENDFHAIRHGLDARVVDLDGRIRPLRVLARRAIRDARDELASDGLHEPLDELTAAIDGEQECERLRRLHAVAGMGALLSDLVCRTAPVARTGDAMPD